MAAAPGPRGVGVGWGGGVGMSEASVLEGCVNAYQRVLDWGISAMISVGLVYSSPLASSGSGFRVASVSLIKDEGSIHSR